MAKINDEGYARPAWKDKPKGDKPTPTRKRKPAIPINSVPDMPSPAWWQGSTLPAPVFDTPNMAPYKPTPLPAQGSGPLREAFPWHPRQLWEYNPIPAAPYEPRRPFRPAPTQSERLEALQDTYRHNVFEPKSWWQTPLWKQTFPPKRPKPNGRIPLAANKSW